jgi:2-oxoisovalerate dehydrogenase E1 component
VKRFVFAEPPTPGDEIATGGVPAAQIAALGGSDVPAEGGRMVRFAEAVRRTLAHELEVNARVVLFGEDVGVKGSSCSARTSA